MRIDRRTTTVGFAALALVGLTSGGIAWAATDAPGSSSSSSIGPCGAGRHLAFGDGSVMTAAADYLGLTPAELATRLRSGQSLADVAGEEGKTVAGLKDAMSSAVEEDLDELITDTHLGWGGMGRGGMDWDDMRDMMGDRPGMMGGRGGGWGGFGGGMMG